jgi:hypothetical protein
MKFVSVFVFACVVAVVLGEGFDGSDSGRGRYRGDRREMIHAGSSAPQGQYRMRPIYRRGDNGMVNGGFKRGVKFPGSVAEQSWGNRRQARQFGGRRHMNDYGHGNQRRFDGAQGSERKYHGGRRNLMKRRGNDDRMY